MTLSELSVRRPVFGGMLVLGLVVLGAVSLGRLEMQLDPDVEFPFVYVVTELRGASPETVEREVSDVLEEQINSIEGIRTLSSVSSQGLSRISIEFGMQYDVDVKAQEVRDKVDLARPALPRDVEDPLVQKFDLNAIAFLTVVLGGPVPVRELSDLAEHEIKERLERLPGVGAVRILGAREREIRIWLDPLRLAGYGLAIEDVADTLRTENAELASGRVEGAEVEWSVTTQGKARSVAEFGELIVAQRGGRVIRLRDVAVVEDGMAEQRTIARLDGQPGVALELQRQSGADIVGAARAARAELASIRGRLPAGVQLRVTRDYAAMIESQVRSVFQDMLLAAGLVVLVVLLFLRSLRSTGIAALAIPSSVVASFTFFLVLDLSLNTMTLMALSLAIGLVIDDAIVVLESIYRRIERRGAPLEAAIEGSREVGLAVISTTLAVCGVFVPILFMTSIVGRYFYEFGVAVTVAVCVSTLVALTLTPMLASRVLRRKAEPGALTRALERAFHALETGYRRLLASGLRHRWVTVGLGLAAVAGGCGVASTLPFNLYNEMDLSEATAQVKLPIGTPLDVTDRVLRRMERVAATHPDVNGVFTAVGSEVEHAPHRGRLDLLLLPKAERSRSIKLTFEELRALLEPQATEAEELSVGYLTFGDSGSSDQWSGLSYSLQGPDLERLADHAARLVGRMRADPDFTDVHSSFETGRPEITLQIDRGRAADLSVSATAIGRTMRTLLAGEKVGSYEDAGRRYDVRVQVLPDYRDDPRRLGLVRVRAANGELIPLANAARMRLEKGPVEIRRDSRTREIRLGANPRAGVALGDVTAKLEAWAAELDIEAPDRLVPVGRVRTMNETGVDIAFAFALGLIAIYMILASLFNSLTQPFVIMLSAPLSFIGGFLALKLTGQALDMMSGIGLLVLMGLVMKNGILLVDYTNQLREQGLARTEAILRAGPVRMRPVLMTSGALIFGMLPMALSTGVGSEFHAPMAIITIGGLTTSTLLTLVVVPVAYDLIDGATDALRGAVGRLRRARPGRAPGSRSAERV
jgi:HAE1 family hydrophobic/amphiphilic exporter-1